MGQVVIVPLVLSFCRPVTEEGKCRGKCRVRERKDGALLAHEDPSMPELQGVVVPRDNPAVMAPAFPLWRAPCEDSPLW